MKSLKMALMALILSPSILAHAGGESGGGGGKKEPLFKTVATNITEWIKSGNADALNNVLVENGLTLATYKREMLKVLQNYNITFTDEKVFVNGHEKTCRGYVNKANITNEIVCNNSQFGSDSQQNIEEIYRQVHHEFAGLACAKIGSDLLCIEQNKNEASDYRISNHIAAFLEEETVLRLPILTNKKAVQCHPLAGVWVEDVIVEMFKADPCSVVVRDATVENGQIKDVLKLDRYKIDCNGDVRIIFGFDEERYPGDVGDIGQLAFNKSGSMFENGYGAKYIRVQRPLLNQMFAAARQCIRPGSR